MQEIIEWRDAELVRCEEAIIVLLITPGLAEGAWPGYKDAGDWYFVDGTRIPPNTVTLWAHLPTGKAVSIRADVNQTELPDCLAR